MSAVQVGKCQEPKIITSDILKHRFLNAPIFFTYKGRINIYIVSFLNNWGVCFLVSDVRGSHVNAGSDVSVLLSCDTLRCWQRSAPSRTFYRSPDSNSSTSDKPDHVLRQNGSPWQSLCWLGWYFLHLSWRLGRVSGALMDEPLSG